MSTNPIRIPTKSSTIHELYSPWNHYSLHPRSQGKSTIEVLLIRAIRFQKKTHAFFNDFPSMLSYVCEDLRLNIYWNQPLLVSNNSTRPISDHHVFRTIADPDILSGHFETRLCREHSSAVSYMCLAC